MSLERHLCNAQQEILQVITIFWFYEKDQMGYASTTVHELDLSLCIGFR